MAEAFYYVDGILTKGLWVDLDTVDDTDDVLGKLADGGIIPRDEDGDPDYGEDLLVATVDDSLAAAFYTSRTDTFDLDGYVEVRDYCAGDEDKEEAAAAFIDWAGNWDRDNFEESYQGRFDNEEAFAEYWLTRLGLDDLPEHLRSYFDYAAFARDLFLVDYYISAAGHVFNCNY